MAMGTRYRLGEAVHEQRTIRQFGQRVQPGGPGYRFQRLGADLGVGLRTQIREDQILVSFQQAFVIGGVQGVFRRLDRRVERFQIRTRLAQIGSGLIA